jgi:pyruvate dehydrogenase E2 component (dihydrolipoamide acetyltransferase)
MITNVGSLGVDLAFAPLVPYSRVPILMAVGAVREAAVVKNGQVVVGQVLPLGVTIDHRLIDGVHGSKMYKMFLDLMRNPEKLLVG